MTYLSLTDHHLYRSQPLEVTVQNQTDPSKTNQNSSSLAKLLKQLRRRKDWSQGDLARQAQAMLPKTSRALISMLESGRRNVNTKLLKTLAQLLCENQFERVELLLAAIGETPDPALCWCPQLVDAIPGNVHTWFISHLVPNVLLPNTRPLKEAREALCNGYQRWYFLPQTQTEQIPNLIQEIFSGINALGRERLGFFTAPDLLCEFHIEVRNYRFPPSADEVTIAGRDPDRRMRLGEGRAVGLLEKLLIPGINQAVHSKSREEFYGFRRIFPEDPPRWFDGRR